MQIWQCMLLSQAVDEQYLRGHGFTSFTSSCEALIILYVCICALVCRSINSSVYLVHHSVIMEADKVSEMFDFIFELTQLFSLVLWDTWFKSWLAVSCPHFFCGYSQSLKADAKIILSLGPSHFQPLFILSSIHHSTQRCSIVLGTLVAYLHNWQKEAMVIAWELYSPFCVITAGRNVRFNMIIDM